MIDYPFCDVLLFTSQIWSGNQPAPFFSPLSLGLLLTQFAAAVWSLCCLSSLDEKGNREGKKVVVVVVWGAKWRGGREKSSVLTRRAGQRFQWQPRAPRADPFDLCGNEFRAKGWNPDPKMVAPPPRRPCSPPCPLLFLINCHYQDRNAGICSLLSRPPHLSCHFISVNKAGEKATSENRMNIWNRGRNLSIETKRPWKTERKEQDLPR